MQVSRRYRFPGFGSKIIRAPLYQLLLERSGQFKSKKQTLRCQVGLR